MKLKKIASLALAGIMAVSMLAGCNGASSNPTDEPEVTPATGTAALINAELDSKKDIIEFKDDSKLQDALTTYFKSNPIDNNILANVDDNGTDVYAAYGQGMAGVDDFVKSAMGVDGKISKVINDTNTSAKTGFDVYVVSAKNFVEENALKLVGQYIDNNSYVTLPEDNATKNYSYTGTVAAINATTKGGTAGVWIVAVTITQTPSDK